MTLAGGHTYATTNSHLTPAIREGLRWIALNTDTSAVMAVNNRFLYPPKADPRYCYYTAFAERRAMLECK